MRFVLDTSVLIAGPQSRRGISRRWLDAILAGEHIAIVKVPLLNKCGTVAFKQRIKSSNTSAASIASFISRASIFLPRYSGVRPTIMPAMNTVSCAVLRSGRGLDRHDGKAADTKRENCKIKHGRSLRAASARSLTDV